MQRLKAFPAFYLEILAFVLMAVNKEKGNQLFMYFFPSQQQAISVEEWAARLEIVHEVANDMNFQEVQKVMSKVITAYKKAGGHRVLTPVATSEVITECLRRSRNSASETEVFNTFVQKVAQKASI